nr:IS110 family transposase [Mesorhizobium loti]
MAWLGSFPPVNHQPEQLHGAVSCRPRTTGRGVDMIMQNYVGCDISKQWLDFFDEASGRCQRIDNHADAIAAHVAGLHPGQDFVVMEATGVHDRLLRHALAKAGVAFSRHNPTHTHNYAKSTARRAKTDPLDARMLSGYGRRYHPEAEPAPREEDEHLQSLARYRDQLVDTRANLKKQLSEAFDEIVIAGFEEMITDFNTRIKALEARIAQVIRQNEGTARDNALMVSVPGVSKVTALSLLALLPELGQRSPKSIAALVGLAPFDNKSGKLRRRSQIQGGRARVRRALYMAALGAIRACDRFKAFYSTIAARSGSKKLAIIAVARKLLVVLNAIIRDQKAFA